MSLITKRFTFTQSFSSATGLNPGLGRLTRWYLCSPFLLRRDSKCHGSGWFKFTALLAHTGKIISSSLLRADRNHKSKLQPKRLGLSHRQLAETTEAKDQDLRAFIIPIIIRKHHRVFGKKTAHWMSYKVSNSLWSPFSGHHFIPGWVKKSAGSLTVWRYITVLRKIWGVFSF